MAIAVEDLEPFGNCENEVVGKNHIFNNGKISHR